MKYQYSPRVDLVVGPLSVEPILNQTYAYNNMLRNINIYSFLEKVYHQHIINVYLEWINEIRIPELHDLVHKNQNARCFIALEIENSSSKKHIMGIR